MSMWGQQQAGGGAPPTQQFQNMQVGGPPQQPGLMQPQQPGLMQQPGIQPGLMQQRGQPPPQQPGLMQPPQQSGVMKPPQQPGNVQPPQQPGNVQLQQPGLMQPPQQPGLMQPPQQPGLMQPPQQPGLQHAPPSQPQQQLGQPGSAQGPPHQPGLMQQQQFGNQQGGPPQAMMQPGGGSHQMGQQPPPTGQPGFARPGPPQQPGVSQPPQQFGGQPPQPGMIPPGVHGGASQQSPMQQMQRGMPPPGPGQGRPGMRPGMVTNQPGLNGAHAQQPGAAKRGINPDQVPSPVVVAAADAEKFQSYYTDSRLPPPLPETKVPIIDNGNCSPLVMRMTTYTVPDSKELQQQCGIPLSLTIKPLADPSGSGNGSVYVVDHGPDGPIRCRRCKTYMNAGVTFVDGGRRWRCNFCPMVQEVPDNYFCNLDHTGRRHDVQSRPELLYGTVEYKATAVYSAKSPQPSSYLFVIDVSYTAVKSGVVEAAAAAIRNVLDHFPHDEGRPSESKIGIVTYGGGIQFYNLTAGLGQPQMMVMTDLHEPFVPLKTGLFVTVGESRDIIDNLLQQLPHMYEHTKATDSFFGAAIDAAIQAMEGIAGRMIVFSAAMPTIGPGALKNRLDEKLLGTDKENVLYAPQHRFYDEKAKLCIKSGIAVDLLLCHQAYMDAATVGVLSHKTGGSVRLYKGFQAHLHSEKVTADVLRIISRRHGCDAMMRVRTSTGLRPTDFYGAFNMENTTDMELAGIDEDKSIVVQCKYDDKLPEGEEACFQAALLYTTTSGERVIRVHTLRLGVGNQIADIFRGADMPATITTIGKMTLRQIRDKTLQEMRNMTAKQCIEILGAYRKHCTNPNTSVGQLILPECLKLLPLYTSCLHKTPAMRTGGVISPDERIVAVYHVLGTTVDQFMAFIYPRMIQVDDLVAEEEGIPSPMRPSYIRLKEHGAYLIENGMQIILWVGARVTPTFISQVLGAPSFQAIDTKQTKLQSWDNAMSGRMRNLVKALRQQRGEHMAFSIVKQKDPTEAEFAALLTEDKSNDVMSYVDFLCAVHRDIQTLNN